MIVSRSRDKEAYLKAAYINVRSMALHDLNALRPCVILTAETTKTTGVLYYL